MATLVMRQSVPQRTPTPPPRVSGLRLNPTTPAAEPTPIPNKHIPYCSPGPAPAFSQSLATPPDSPPSDHAIAPPSSVLESPTGFNRVSKCPPVYSIDSSTLDEACAQQASQTLPEPKQLFPWLHGLNPENQVQLQFFLARRRTQWQTPRCYRGITLVKVGGDLSRAAIGGAVASHEILNSSMGSAAAFLDLDPKQGFSVRNFQIQAAKIAVMSDIVVYRDENTTDEEMYHLARRLSNAQDAWRAKELDLPQYHTFMLQQSFEEVAESYPHLVTIDADGNFTDGAIEFSQLEKREMAEMTEASEIAANVWLGPTPDSMIDTDDQDEYDIMIEATDLAPTPDFHTLRRLGEMSYSSPQQLEFPASGSITIEQISRIGADPISQACHWIYRLANPTAVMGDVGEDKDGDIKMQHLSPRPRKILIHCTDGYTESTLLAVAYFMYAEQVPLHEALLRLHKDKGRNFFAYPSDVPLLTALEAALVQCQPEPKRQTKNGNNKRRSSSSAAASLPSPTLASPRPPAWLSLIDGSLPSRILPYMYLGNLGHANNPDLLRAMGITQVLSVGEPVTWTKMQLERWGRERMLVIGEVQDNGVDSLMQDFDRCLDFIARGKSKNTATLVHCRVGVSRSATICIAEVMRTLQLSFPRAYCYVRARRLNVIIQPHLRFAYELVKWEETCSTRGGDESGKGGKGKLVVKEGNSTTTTMVKKREMEWAHVAREIAGLNKPYCSR